MYNTWRSDFRISTRKNEESTCQHALDVYCGSQAREWCPWNHGTPKEVSQLEANTSTNEGKGSCGLCDRHDVLRHSSALNHETDDLGFNKDWGIGDQVISTNCNGERNKQATNPKLVQTTPIWI